MPTMATRSRRFRRASDELKHDAGSDGVELRIPDPEMTARNQCSKFAHSVPRWWQPSSWAALPMPIPSFNRPNLPRARQRRHLSSTALSERHAWRLQDAAAGNPVSERCLNAANPTKRD